MAVMDIFTSQSLLFWDICVTALIVVPWLIGYAVSKFRGDSTYCAR